MTGFGLLTLAIRGALRGLYVMVSLLLICPVMENTYSGTFYRPS